jgi:hypothetical protein
MTTLQVNLEAIRKVVDMPVADDIESIRGKGAALSGMLGLSAECKKNAKLEIGRSQLIALAGMDDSWPASVKTKSIDAHCAEQISDYEYADRLNAALTHQLEYVRSLLSFYKQEMAIEASAAFHNT